MRGNRGIGCVLTSSFAIVAVVIASSVTSATDGSQTKQPFGAASLVRQQASPTPAPATYAAQPESVRFGGANRSLRTLNGSPHIVMTKDNTSLDAAIALLADAPDDVWRSAIYGFVANVDDTTIARLRTLPGVIAIERDAPLSHTGEQVGAPWGLDRIDQRTLPLDGTYSYAHTGQGVDAYVVDSGLWFTHVEFTGRIGTGAYYDFADGFGPWDCDGHGTHVAGTLGGATHGIAKDVTIIPVKVFSCDGRTDNSILIGAIEWIINDHVAGQPAVANFSLGGPATSADLPLEAALEALIADGVTVVVSAGNSALPSCGFSPARVPAAITVAASNSDDDDADFSNYGSCNDIFAPGVGIMSAWAFADDHTAQSDGTSMAAPHVAGAAALVLEASPTATPAQVWEAIDAASTKGELSECCGDPDKLLYVGAPAPPATTPTTTTTPPTTAPPTTSTPPSGPPSSPPQLAPLVPARLLETRPGLPTADSQYAGIGRRPNGSTTTIRINGRNAIPPDATAVMLNVTAVAPSAPGFLTVFPCDQPQPNASHVNYNAGDVIPNAVLAKTSNSGDICIYTVAETDILIDATGYVPAGGSPIPLVPARLLETRPGLPTADSQYAGIGRRPNGSTTTIRINGRNAIPPDATAVMLNVTAVAPSAPGFLTVFPCDQPQPNASHVNYNAGDVIPNAVLAKTSNSGDICIYTVAETDILIDATGYVSPTG